MRRVRTPMAVAGVVVIAAGLTGCGPKSSASSSSSAARSVAAATTSAAMTTQAAATSSTGSSAMSTTKAVKTAGASGTAKHCAASAVVGVIGGATKCLEPGQMCSHKHAADYGKYGFACEAKGSSYVLRKL